MRGELLMAASRDGRSEQSDMVVRSSALFLLKIILRDYLLCFLIGYAGQLNWSDRGPLVGIGDICRGRMQSPHRETRLRIPAARVSCPATQRVSSFRNINTLVFSRPPFSPFHPPIYESLRQGCIPYPYSTVSS